MVYTADKVKDEITPDIRKEMITSMKNDKDYSSYSSISIFVELWVAGCWLNEKLKENGFSEEDMSNIGFEHGRMCFGRDPYEMAARQYNKYVAKEKVENLEGSPLQYNEETKC